MSLADLSATDLAIVALAAALIGFAKTAVSGAGTISVALFALVLPARESTGALLPLLIFGDIFAVATYRTSAHWPTIARLVGPVGGRGRCAGAAFVAVSGDTLMRRTSVSCILALVALRLAMLRWRPDQISSGEQGHVERLVGGQQLVGHVAETPVAELAAASARRAGSSETSPSTDPSGVATPAARRTSSRSAAPTRAWSRIWSPSRRPSSALSGRSDRAG